MDATRFDSLVRTLADVTTRRRTVQCLAGGALVGLLAYVGIEDAAAGCVKPGQKGCKGPKDRKCCTGARCRGGTKEKEGRCVCKTGLKKCGTRCVNTATSEAHCGTCNNVCAAGTTCAAGQCPCPKEQTCDVSAPCGPDGSGCACHFTVEGPKACVIGEYGCGEFPACTATSQCAEGSVCIESCCAASCVPLCGSEPAHAVAAAPAGGPSSSLR